MSILSICQTIAEKIKAVYAKGKTDGTEEERARFWNDFYETQERHKKGYIFSGAGWNESTFTSDRTVSLETIYTDKPICLFGYCAFEIFPAVLEDGVTPALDTSGFTVLNSLFANAERLAEIRCPLDLSSCTDMSYAFYGSRKLHTAVLSNVSGVGKWSNAFMACDALRNIGQENENFGYFSSSVNLSQTAIDFGTDKMALIGVLGHLVNGEAFDQSRCFLQKSPSTSQTLTISAAQLAQAVQHMDEVTDGAITSYESFVTWLGWTLIVV